MCLSACLFSASLCVFLPAFREITGLSTQGLRTRSFLRMWTSDTTVPPPPYRRRSSSDYLCCLYQAWMIFRLREISTTSLQRSVKEEMAAMMTQR